MVISTDPWTNPLSSKKPRRWSLHGTIKSKSTGRIQIGKWSDHKGIKCELKVTILAAKNAGNSPVINYAAD